MKMKFFTESVSLESRDKDVCTFTGFFGCASELFDGNVETIHKFVNLRKNPVCLASADLNQANSL